MAKFRSIPADADTARRLFFEQGGNPQGWVPDVIARSWARCSHLLDNADSPPPQRVDSSLLNERREARGRLRRIVRPEMDALAELVSDSDSLVLLADADGLILDAVGGLGFLSKAEQVALQPGVVWSEQGRGTNAIGTALAEARPVDVRGRQHYLEANGLLSCAAAPILSPRGELLGVLDVSGDAEQLQSQALGMVRLAIQIIEHRLTKDMAADHALLRFHHTADLLGSHREGILILDDTRIVGANRAALSLLDADWEELLDSDAERWLSLPTGSPEQGQRLHGPEGRSFHGTVKSRASLQVPVGIALPGEQDNALYSDADTEHQLERARRVLEANIPVLICGETGAGKEVFARRLHAASARAAGPFVGVNCAALPETLIESELFGYESGAFTGARRKGMPGRIREAQGGVLFLDEIGDMPLTLQTRLLRVLQEREVLPLGSGRPVAVDFALICASHRDLGELVSAGHFREDLYYRIQDFRLTLPPLRERADRERIIEVLMQRLGGKALGLRLNDEARAALTAYSWPGNLRQLNGVLRTLIALAEPGEMIGLRQLPEDIREAMPALLPMSRDLQTHTRQAIEQALEDCNGSVSAAARRLGIHRSTIYRRLGRRDH